MKLSNGFIDMVAMRKVVPGICFCTGVFFLAYLTSLLISEGLPSNAKSPIPPVMFSVLIGILLRNMIKLDLSLEEGISFSVSYVLRLGIILLGIRIGLGDVIEYGALAVPLIVICIITALFFIRMAKLRFQISTEMSYLIAIGTSICGASAIIALAPVINAKKAEISYAVANIVLWGLFGMFFYPFIAKALFAENHSATGLFLGTAIHDTAQVAASGLIYEQYFSNAKVLEIATITKLVRNTFLLLLIPAFGYIYARGKGAGSYSLKKIFPTFVLGFIFMVILRTAGDWLASQDLLFSNQSQWQYLVTLLKTGSGICLGVAMAALGLSTRLVELRTIGFRPFFVGFGAALLIALVSYWTISLYIKLQLLG